MGTQDLAPFVHQAFKQWRRFDFGPNSSINSFWRDELTKDPELKNAFFCMELFFGGDTIVRISQKDMRTSSGRDGREFVWKPILQVEPIIDSTYSLFSPTSAARSFRHTIPNAEVDASEIIARGRTLAGFGELSIQIPDMDYDLRLVIMRGDMDDGVTYAPADAGQVEFSLTDPKSHADLNLSSWVAEQDRLNGILELLTPGLFATLLDRSVGQRYPIVFNRYIVPGLLLNTNSALIVSKVLVAYGHGHTINTVTINTDDEDSGDAEFGFTTEEAFDDFGVPVTLVKLNGTHQWDGGETIHIDVTSGTEPSTGLFDIIKNLLQQFTTLGNSGISQELFAAAEVNLGPNSTRAMINGSGGATAAKAIEYIESGLLQSYPMVSMIWDGSGYGPVVTDHRSDIVVAELRADRFPIRERVSEVQEIPKSQLFNNFTFRYDFDIIRNVYASVITRHPNNSILCGVSRENVGERHHTPIESPNIYDDGVAEYIIDWLVDHRSLPSYYLEYNTFPWVRFFLRLGQNIRWTDDVFNWERVSATVEKISYGRAHCTLGLRVWHRYYELGGGAINQTL